MGHVHNYTSDSASTPKFKKKSTDSRSINSSKIHHELNRDKLKKQSSNFIGY
jgi:hypothetical protein